MYKRFLLAAVVVVAASAAAVATAALLEIKDDTTIFLGAGAGKLPLKAGALDGVDAGGPQTILLLGSDQRYVDIKAKNPVRSDTIILLRLDPSKGATAVMSLPRDLKVRIPGHGTDKINAAYAIGGPTLAVKTIRSLLHIPINHVVNVNFGGFRRAVDRLGCVYTDVDRRYFNDNRPPFGGGAELRDDRRQGRLPEALRPGRAGLRPLPPLRHRLRARRAPAAVPGRRQGPDRRRQAVQRPQGAAEDLRALHADRHQLRRRDPAAAQARLRVGAEARPGGALPGRHHRRLRDRHPVAPGRGDRALHERDAVEHAEVRRERHRQEGGVQEEGVVQAQGQDGAAAGRAGRRPGRRGRGRRAGDQAAVLGVLPQGRDHRRVAAARPQPRLRHLRPRRAQVPGLPHGLQDRRRWASTTASRGPAGTGRRSSTTPASGARLGGRTYELFYDGSRLRLVSWRSGKAVYWISNTLLSSLGNQQMLALARSVGRIR